MEEIRIKEVSSAFTSINSKVEIHFPKNIWLSEEVLKYPIEFKVLVTGNVEFTPLFTGKESVIEITSENELKKLFAKLSVDIEAMKTLRLEVRETKTMGRKPLFLDGLNAKKIYCELIERNNQRFFMLFNLHGTRALESIYIHGVWKLD